MDFSEVRGLYKGNAVSSVEGARVWGMFLEPENPSDSGDLGEYYSSSAGILIRCDKHFQRRETYADSRHQLPQW